MNFILLLTGFSLFASVGISEPDGFEFRRNFQQTKAPDSKMEIKQTKLVPVSIWGGNGIRVTVEQKKVTVEYACADGEIAGRLKTDARGNFKVNGIHIRQRGGPVRVDAKPESQPVRYEGKITGRTMTISVTLTQTGENIGTFELKRDVTPRLIRCL